MSPLRLHRICMFACFILSSPLFAQDDPRYDHNPLIPLGPSLGPRSIEVITAEDGFDNFDLGVDQAEPHMSTNPRSPLWYFNAFNINNAHRTINGLDWVFSQPAFGFAMRGDPVTAYDSLGNLYYESMYGSPNILGCKLMVSTDNGATWSPSVTSVAGVDKNWLAADQTRGPYANYVYTTMTAGGGTGNFARSTDYGATWTTTATFTQQNLPGMMVAVGPNILGGNNISGGCVYVVTHGGTNSAGIYRFHVSTDGGQTFTFRSQQAFTGYIGTEIGGRSTVNGMRTRPYPMIAADNSFGPYRGRLYLVYATNEPAGNGNKPDIFLHYSTDQGATWSPRVRVNDDPNPQANHQFFPAIWTDKETGRLYIKWYDSRRVPTSDSMDVYATYTDDGGATFAPNQRISNKTFVTKIASSGNPPAYQGDYDAITSYRFGAMAVWTDFRNNNFLSMTAYLPDFAMLVSPAADSVRFTDSTTIMLKVPAVKLYEHGVKFTASVTPAANITFGFPQGDSLTSFPDSLPLVVQTNNVAEGNYAVTILGSGPNGTPVHRRTVTIVARHVPNTVAVQQPNGGEVWIQGTSQEIRWTRSGDVDSVRLEYSTDNGSSWSVIVSGVDAGSPHQWTVPSTPTTQARVRVTWLDSLSIADQSDAPFTISSPTPLITTAPDSLVAMIPFGPNTAADTLTIGNDGTLPLNWVIANLPAWTTATPSSGIVSAGGAQTVPVVFDGTGIPGGTYFANFTITSNDIVRPAITIPTRLTVTTAPAISLPVSSFNYGSVTVGDSSVRSLVVRNIGTGPLTVSSMSISQGNDYRALPSGDQVVPPVVTGGSGTGSFRLNTAGTQLDYRIYVSGLSGSVTAANFRVAPRGSNGSAIRTITFTGDSAIGSWTNVGIGALTPALVDSLRRGKVYVNIQTAANPTGEIRGQVDGSFTMNEAGATIAPGDSLVREMKFRPVAAASFAGSIRIVSNDPDPTDDTLFVSLAGTGEAVVSVGESVAETPTMFALEQNYPNPFNPSTVISFQIPVHSLVTLTVFNILGEKVASLASGHHEAGRYDYYWDGRTTTGVASSGVYLYRLEAHGDDGMSFVRVRRMMVLK